MNKTSFDILMKVVKEIDSLGYLSTVLSNASFEEEEEDLFQAELNQLLKEIKDNALYKVDATEEPPDLYLNFQGKLIRLQYLVQISTVDEYNFDKQRMEYKIVFNEVEIKFKPSDNLTFTFEKPIARDKAFEEIERQLEMNRNVKIIKIGK